MVTLAAPSYAGLSDLALARRVAARDAGAARHLLTLNNQRLFRAAWSILLDRAEAEDAVQEAYVKAFAALSSFKGESALSTWLTRIVVNEALERKRRAGRRQRLLESQGVAFIETYREALMRGSAVAASQEQAIMRAELAKLIETAVGRLPEVFRPVFVLREIEGLSVAETAAALDITEATVRTRLHRAKHKLQAELEPQVSGVRAAMLPFAGLDCQALTTRVLQRLGFDPS
ncbi:MAG TPA: RNA polymerase sigma factor [Caulobacteraceae bacterium]|jgi:RNA polymerase sigma-70 factor (ECF subfamily)|nr:RNA polymerase sigma factor [Caulobacteraceae bacterium]